MVRSLALAAAAALAALPAAADDYLLTGPETAGHASVTAGKPGHASVKIHLRTFGAHGGESDKTVDVALGKPGSTAWQAAAAKGAKLTWTPLALAAGKIAVLAIPGLSTNQWNKIGVPYLDENVAALQALGFPARRLAIKTEDGVAKNAAFIAAEIGKEAAAGRKVVLFGHSKGATDALAAVALDAAARANVLGVVALQPVYGGSPIAQVVEKHAALDKAVKLVFERVFGGQVAAVNDLAFDSRAAFNQAHPYPAAEVPTVVVRSTFHRKLSKSILWANEKVITLEWKQPNDGMVELKDEAVPGARATITLDDLDHFEAGLRNESKHKPVEITSQAMLALLQALK